MKKYPLIGGSIIAVVLLVLGSLTNVVGYQTVQSSNQKVIKEEVDQKELLFQTIVDMANNKEIQKVILGSEITGKRFFGLDMRFSTFTPPVLAKKFLNFAYHLGLIFSISINKSKIHLMLERYQVNNQGVKKEINAVIEKDTTLNGEIAQLSASKCDCEKDRTIGLDFPVICEILWYMFLTITIFPYILFPIWVSAIFIAIILNCTWTQP
jgi:hypothetical protein